MSKQESTTRPNYGTASEIKPGTQGMVTITNPDGSQTVVPVAQAPKPKPSYLRRTAPPTRQG
jgi:hypothetical protein